MDLIKVNQSKCIKCGICVNVCQPKILSMRENRPIAIEPQGCIACGQCVAICPNSAIDNIKTPLNNQTILNKFPVINKETAKQFLRSRRSIRCYKDMTVQREQLIELFANTLGLGSCWAGLFEMCAFANYYPLLGLFNIPKNKVLTGAVMVGYLKYVYKRLVDRSPLDVTWI